MTSLPPQIFQANTLCQLLNDYGAPKFPLTWNSKTKAWNCISEHKIPEYIVTTLFIKGSIFLIEMVILIWGSLHSEQLNLTQHVCNVLSIFLIVTTLLLDFIVWKDGSKIVITANWALQRDYLVTSLKYDGNLKYWKVSYLLAVTFVILATVSHIFVVMFLIDANLDPIYLAAWSFARDSLQNELFKGILKVVCFASMISIV